MSEEPPAKREPAGSLRRFLPLAILVGGLAFAYLMGWHQYLTLEFLADSRGKLASVVASKPVLAPLAFGIVYMLAVAFSVPAASILTIFGGFLFGCLTSSPIVAFAATAGATVLFPAPRTAFGDLLKARIGDRAAQLARGFEENAFSYLLALRLAPVFPFFVVNIAPAFFNVSLRTYVTATFLGILPGVAAYSYLGEGLDSVIDAAEQAGTNVSVADLATPKITVAFMALALVAAIPPIVRTLRKRRREN